MDTSHSVVIVGAGPAGLSVAACLARRGITPLVVDRRAQAGGSFVTHYASLRLHTTRRQSALPYQKFTSGAARHPTRSDVLSYLDGYRKQWVVDVQLGTDVMSIHPEGIGFRIETPASAMRAKAVVLACGFHAEPVVPDLPGLETFAGEWFHSAQYATAAPFAAKRVLVVGAGNSGADIATDLVRAGARVTWSIREPVFAVPLWIGALHWRTLYELAPNMVLPVGRRLGIGKLMGRATALVWERIARAHFPRQAAIELASADAIDRHFADFRPPLTNTEVFELSAQGKLTVQSAVTRFAARAVHFAGGSEDEFDAVILATGYAPARLFSTLSGDPRRLRDGPVPNRLGLFVCGSRPELSQIGRSARKVAAQVTNYLIDLEHAGSRVRGRAVRSEAP